MRRRNLFPSQLHGSHRGPQTQVRCARAKAPQAAASLRGERGDTLLRGPQDHRGAEADETDADDHRWSEQLFEDQSACDGNAAITEREKWKCLAELRSRQYGEPEGKFHGVRCQSKPDPSVQIPGMKYVASRARANARSLARAEFEGYLAHDLEQDGRKEETKRGECHRFCVAVARGRRPSLSGAEMLLHRRFS